jgi:hypothetical protein
MKGCELRYAIDRAFKNPHHKSMENPDEEESLSKRVGCSVKDYKKYTGWLKVPMYLSGSFFLLFHHISFGTVSIL